MNVTLLKRPAGWLPLAMSGAAIAVLLLRIAFVGTQPAADEGTAAHLWQLLIGGQLPVMLYFAIRCVPEAPLQALRVLGFQIAGVALACAPVFYFKW